MYKSTLIAFVSLFSIFSANAQESKELNLVIKSELNRDFHTTIDGKGEITLNLTFSEEELGVDQCYSIHHAIRTIEGWYSYNSAPDQKIRISGGVLSLDTMYLYVGTRKHSNSGIKCGKWIDFQNGEEEVKFAERFMFTGSGSNTWSDNKTTQSVGGIFSSQDDLVKKSMFVALEDGRNLDLMPAITDQHMDLLFPHSNLYYSKCFTSGNQINILLVKQNEYSCWNEYQDMIYLSFDKNTFEVIESKRYQISKCDKLACDFIESKHEDNRTYDIYEYGFEDGGDSREVLVGQFQIEKAKVRILKKWF